MQYKNLKFWTYYETAKFTWDESDWLGKLNKQIPALNIVAKDTQAFLLL